MIKKTIGRHDNDKMLKSIREKYYMKHLNEEQKLMFNNEKSEHQRLDFLHIAKDNNKIKFYKKSGNLGTCRVQVLRSSCEWSSGIK